MLVSGARMGDSCGMDTPRPFHLLAKPIGPRCNIDCSYCYYLEKEKLYPEGRVQIVDAHIQEINGKNHVTVASLNIK